MNLFDSVESITPKFGDVDVLEEQKLINLMFLDETKFCVGNIQNTTTNTTVVLSGNKTSIE